MSDVRESGSARAMRRAAVLAHRAPSVHNTQPWRFVVTNGALEVHADRSRQLRVLDPRSRQLVLSCGCAVLNARVAFAESGLGVDVVRWPAAHRRDLVARLIPTTARAGDPALARLYSAIELRRMNRRRFIDDTVPHGLVAELAEAVRAEGATLHEVDSVDERLAVARLTQMADRIENADPAYRAELRSWTSDDPRRTDGVQAYSVPHVDGTAADDVPIRDFDSTGMGWLPSHTGSSSSATLVVIGTDGDDPVAWLRAGEALERVLLHLTSLGYAASPLTQAIEVPQTHALLRAELGLTMHPHVLLRIGRAPEVARSRRRRLADVLVEQM